MPQKIIIVNQFDTEQACRVSGLTTTMLDYLVREGFVVPSASTKRGRGNRRLFSFGDVVTMKVIRQLLKSGIEIRRLSRGLRNFRKKFRDATASALPYRFLVTDGTDVFLEQAGAVESLTQGGQLSFFFLIDLSICASDILTDSPAQQFKKKA
ncbi:MULTISPECIES: MerR family transcriptional regulator [unclassified Mesorhizobium]|uniref:helix-turn-helix domain-containing protein n=2 Tax=unclassified Mesorhizobium TaxID=325217 RepID=UPI0024761388|nr:MULTISPECIES: MerR family transcriptional regulator [unclassified Mesorhizobium]